MLAVALLLLVVAVALGVQLARTNARLRALSEDLGEATQARAAADAARRTAEAATEAARKERDDALERANRARRDAADVARRMKEEADARARAEVERAAAEASLAEAEAAASGGDHEVAELWALALASVRRTWEVSVAPSPGLPSPLDGSDDELRDAVAIEVDAAREEAGAAIDLEWTGDAVASPAVAVRTLALAREVIGRLAKATEAAVLRVEVEGDAVTLEVTGTDAEGAPAPVELLLAGVATEQQVAPGRFQLRSARGGPPGT